MILTRHIASNGSNNNETRTLWLLYNPILQSFNFKLQTFSYEEPHKKSRLALIKENGMDDKNPTLRLLYLQNGLVYND